MFTSCEDVEAKTTTLNSAEDHVYLRGDLLCTASNFGVVKSRQRVLSANKRIRKARYLKVGVSRAKRENQERLLPSLHTSLSVTAESVEAL